MTKQRIRTIAKAASALVIGANVAIRIGAVAVVPRDRRPSTAMAWLMAIFLAPIPGTALFALFGSSKVPQHRRDKQRQINDLILHRTDDMDDVIVDHPRPPWFAGVARLNRTLGAMPLMAGTRTRLLPDYHASIRAMASAIDEASRYVHVEFYILTIDDSTRPFFDAMRRAHDRGVQVRVLFDDWATSRNPRGSATKRWLVASGIAHHPMLPFRLSKSIWRRPDLRNHRKIVVVDGDVAFTGSQNMTDPSYNKPGNIRRGLQWKDLMVRLDGPAAIGLNAVFVTDWYSETDELITSDDPEPRAEQRHGDATFECQIVPSGPGFDGENNLKLFNSLVYAAQERLVIASPYFVPDDSMLSAITTAAGRGVEVQLFACEVADQLLVHHAQRSYYETLLRAGVRIFLYRSPVVLHAKHFTVDDDAAVIGSSNMDMRSFSLNYEVSLLVHGRDFVARVRGIEDDYRANARELTLEEWLRRGRVVETLDNVARLTATVQ